MTRIALLACPLLVAGCVLAGSPAATESDGSSNPAVKGAAQATAVSSKAPGAAALPATRPDRSSKAMLEGGFELVYNPYDAVNWHKTIRCLSQHHDHVVDKEERIRAYDDAGYQAIVILHYSGVKSRSYQLTKRLWPLTATLTKYASDADFLASCKNLKILIPAAEENGCAGGQHITSPFLTSYIAKWEPGQYEKREPWHYDSAQDCIDLINKGGGMAFIAHPESIWNSAANRRQFKNYRGMEVYNASESEERNKHFREVWDTVLDEYSTRIWGIAVNDWKGPPFAAQKDKDPKTFDSGKTLVLIDQFTLEDYRKAIDEGSFFAIRDNGVEKRQYPEIRSISVTHESITIATDGHIRWFANKGAPAGEGVLRWKDLPSTTTYVRAEVSDTNGIVYTQPFSIQSTSQPPAPLPAP